MWNFGNKESRINVKSTEPHWWVEGVPFNEKNKKIRVSRPLVWARNVSSYYILYTYTVKLFRFSFFCSKFIHTVHALNDKT